MALQIVKKAISDLFPSADAKLILEFLRQEITPVLKDLREAFNKLATGPYDYGTIRVGTGAPVAAPSSASRGIYIQLDGGALSTLWVWNGVAWEPK